MHPRPHNFLSQAIRHYSLPSILALFVGNAGIFIDTMVASFVLGLRGLEVMALVNLPFNIIRCIALIFAVGASIEASISVGERAHTKKLYQFSFGLYAVLILSLLTTALGLLFSRQALQLFGTPDYLMQDTAAYFHVMLAGCLFLNLMYLPIYFSRIEGNSYISLFIFLIYFILNTALDLVFTLVFPWSYFGLSLATVLSCAIASIWGFAQLTKAPLNYQLKDLKGSLRYAKASMAAGSPLALDSFYLVIFRRIINEICLHCSFSAALATYVFASAVSLFAESVVKGLAQAVAAIFGVLFGERNGAAIQQLLRKSLAIGLALSLLAVALSVLALPLLSQLAEDIQEKPLLVAAVVFMGLALVFYSVTLLYITIFAIEQKTKLANFITLVQKLLMPSACAYIGYLCFDFVGVMLGLCVADALTMLLVIVFGTVAKKNNPDFENTFLLSHKELFKGKRIYLSSTLEAAAIKQLAFELEKQYLQLTNNLNNKTKLSACTTQLLELLAQQSSNRAQQSASVGLIIYDKSCLLILRSTGQIFNPIAEQTKRQEFLDRFDLKSLSYHSVLATNTLEAVI